MAVKDDWKEFGGDTGKAFKGLGKALVKSVKRGFNKASGDDPKPGEEEPDLRKDWSGVGHSFGDAGKAIGKAFSSTAKKVVKDKDDAKAAGSDGAAAEAPAGETPADEVVDDV